MGCVIIQLHLQPKPQQVEVYLLVYMHQKKNATPSYPVDFG